ncbi:hypothetical protein SB659_19895, partial [Arthrobacter sp. SIMBA_036]
NILKKTILLLIGLFSLQYHSQNFIFKTDENIESSSFDNNIKKLNKEILQVYKSNDKIKFYDNIFRLYILGGDYEKGLYYLNEIKD